MYKAGEAKMFRNEAKGGGFFDPLAELVGLLQSGRSFVRKEHVKSALELRARAAPGLA